MAQSGHRIAHVEANACPSCHRPKAAGALECPGCGVVFAKYRGPAGPAPSAQAASNSSERISPRQLEVLLSTLSAAIGAGMTPAAFADSEVVNQLPPKAAARLRAELSQGVPLSDVLERLAPGDEAGISLFRARERQGDLAGGLKALADRRAQQRKDLARTAAALAYPGVLLFLACLILPLPLLVQGAGAYLARALPGAFAVVAAAAAAFYFVPRLPASSAIRRGIRRIGWALPVSSAALRHQAIGTFVELLASCLRAGLTARESLELASAGSAHPVLEKAGRSLVAQIEKGATLAAALAGTGVFKPGDIAQIDVAERSGTTDRVLPALAADHQSRARFLIIAGIGAVSVLALLAVVGVLAWSVVSGWTDIFQTQGKDIDKLMNQ